MAKAAEIKIADDIEYRVIGNAVGLLISSAGLLAGEMVRQRSTDYWMEDIVPLVLCLWLAYRLFRNFLSTMLLYQNMAPPVQHARSAASSIQGERVVAGQLPHKPLMSSEKVVEQVAKRIEAQKNEKIKKNAANN